MFNKNFDKMLWIILESDTENRKEIIEFLKSIPEDLIFSIKKVLEDNRDFESSCSQCFEKSVISEYGTVFSYIIEYFTDEVNLIVKHELTTPSNDTNSINLSTELTLNFPTDFSISSYLGEEIYVGDYSRIFEVNGESKQVPTLNRNFTPFFDLEKRRVTGLIEEQEYEYGLFINEQGSVVKRSLLRGPIEYNEINIELMPEKIDMDYIDKRYGDDNKLIKKK